MSHFLFFSNIFSVTFFSNGLCNVDSIFSSFKKIFFNLGKFLCKIFFGIFSCGRRSRWAFAGASTGDVPWETGDAVGIRQRIGSAGCQEEEMKNMLIRNTHWKRAKLIGFYRQQLLSAATCNSSPIWIFISAESFLAEHWTWSPNCGRGLVEAFVGQLPR